MISNVIQKQLKRAARNGDCKGAVKLLRRIISSDMTPTTTTMNNLIEAANRARDTKTAQHAFTFLTQEYGVKPDMYTYTSLITSAKLNRRYDHAVSYFEECPFKPNTVLYNAMISACEKSWRNEDAFQYYDDMLSSGVTPDVYTFTSLISICAQSTHTGSKKGFQLWDDMINMGIKPSLVTYTALLKLCIACKKGDPNQIYESLLNHGLVPNAITYSLLIQASGTADNAEAIFDDMKQHQNISPDIILYNTLLNVYVRARDSKRVSRLFRTMKSDNSVSPDTVTLSHMLSHYANIQDFDSAEHLWDVMISHGVVPAFPAFKSIISLCDELGLEEEKQEYLAAAKRAGVSLLDSRSPRSS